MPTLQHDPLFHGPDDPCLLEYPQYSALAGRGTVIVCPGGNYEFLSPLEGLPVVEWLAQHNIGAVVLKYRLLPHYDLDDALDDLEAAAARVRESRPGPVAALGFSAGGHLIASLALRAAQRGQRQPLDAQVLVYPGIDGRDWDHPEYNGFFNLGRWKIPAKAAKLHRGQDALLGGEEFAAPPTCLVGSTDDTCTPNEQHTDIYQRALDERDIPHVYLRDAFGEHGFELKGGWTPGCIKWLKSRNFGGAKQAAGRHAMSLRQPAPRILQDSAAANHDGASLFDEDDPMECGVCDTLDRGCSSSPLPADDEGHSSGLGKPPASSRFPPPPVEAPLSMASNDATLGLLRHKELSREFSSSASSTTESVFACTPAPSCPGLPGDLGIAMSAQTDGTLPTEPAGFDSAFGFGGGSSSFGAASKPFAKPSGKPKASGGGSLKNLNKPSVTDPKRAAQKAHMGMEPADENASAFGSSFAPSGLGAHATFPTTFGAPFPASTLAPDTHRVVAPTSGKAAMGAGAGGSSHGTKGGMGGGKAVAGGWPSSMLHGRATRGSTIAAAKTGGSITMSAGGSMPPPRAPGGEAMVDCALSHGSSSAAPLGHPPAMVFDLNTSPVAPPTVESPMAFGADAVEV